MEPRLSGMPRYRRCTRLPLAPGRVVQSVQCGPAVPPPTTRICDEIIETREQAVSVLVRLPQCTDTAIPALERFTTRDKSAAGDLAAAYYVRAQKEDRPEDLLPALEAALEAPPSAEGTFNRALIEEALGLNDAAIASWEQYLKDDHSDWAAEAREHRDVLVRAKSLDAARQWPRVVAELPAAVRQRNRARVDAFIEPFRRSVAWLIENDLLAQWADNPSQPALDDLKFLAGEHARITGDPYLADVVNAIATTPPERLDALREGFRAYRDARRADFAKQTKTSAEAYQRALAGLRDARNPLVLSAELGAAVDRSFDPDGLEPSVKMLEPIERACRQRGYRRVLASVLSQRGYCRFFQGRYSEAFSDSDTASAELQRIGDDESIAALNRNWFAYKRVAGQLDAAWRDALGAVRQLSRVVAAQGRNILLGETAACALSLGHPRAALMYQEAAVLLMKRELVGTPPNDLDAIRNAQKNLSIAVRERAAIELHLNQFAAADRDLNESVRLNGEDSDPKVRRVLQARIEEVRGLRLLASNPVAAAAAFSNAFGLTSQTEYPTFRASLLAERAAAHRALANRIAAEQDLRASLDVLREEESRILSGRQVGKSEDLWSPYFARFRETYERLIRLLIEDGRVEEALAYAERARAFEPLNLVLRRKDTPDAFRSLIAADGTPNVAAMRAALPSGTFIVEYLVLKDATYAWVLSHDAPTWVLKLRAKEDAVKRWTDILQTAARQGDSRTFDGWLRIPYDELIKQPLGIIRKLPRGATPRLVIVPDGPMQGLPLAPLQDPASKQRLVQMAPIAVDGSAALYLYSVLRDRQLKPNRSALLVGDPTFDAQLLPARGLKPLPGAEHEVERIAQLYEHAETLKGAEATIEQFLTRAKGKGTVHVAAHAIADAQAPSHSMLLLASSNSDSGALDAQQLLTRFQSNETRLVVLSACSSAGGLPVGPEGVGPLVRPLIAAGVPAVIGSLWDVEDATAEELLVSFHRHYGDSSDAAVALQLAQIELLNTKNPGFQSALAWGSFQVIGYAAAPSRAPTQKQETSLDGLHSSHSLQRPHGLRSQSGR